MRNRWKGASIAALAFACAVLAQQPAETSKSENGKTSSQATAPISVGDMLESKVRASWAAFKSKDKKAYAEFLADDFTAIEADNEGERNKWHVLREVERSMIFDYKLQLFKVMPLGENAALVTYESTIQFPPKSAVRFERVFISEVWVRRDGQWKAVYYQETRVK